MFVVAGVDPGNAPYISMAFFIALMAAGITSFYACRPALVTTVSAVVLLYIFIAPIGRRWVIGGLPVFDVAAVMLLAGSVLASFMLGPRRSVGGGEQRSLADVATTETIKKHDTNEM